MPHSCRWRAWAKGIRCQKHVTLVTGVTSEFMLEMLKLMLEMLKLMLGMLKFMLGMLGLVLAALGVTERVR